MELNEASLNALSSPISIQVPALQKPFSVVVDAPDIIS
jgi:hypothetical protein